MTIRAADVRRRAVLVAVLAAMCVAFAATGAHAVPARFEFADENRVAQIEMLVENGMAYFRLRDIALALTGIRYWNPRTGKVTLAVSDHVITMSPDSRFAVLDRSVVNLRAPVLLKHGDIWVPQGLVVGALASALDADVSWRPSDRVIRVERLRPSVVSLSLSESPDGTVVELGLSSPAVFTALSSTRAAVEIVLPGAQLPDSLGVSQDTDYVSGVTIEESPDGVTAKIAVTDRASSYGAQLLMNPTRIEVLVRGGRDPIASSLKLRDVKRLLPGSDDVFAASELGTETVMVDPAHGGTDPGSVGSGGLEEKSVTLSLTRELSRALQREGFYVFATRSSDSYVPDHRRAEIANLAVADIFVSVQCGAWFSGWARGFSVSYYEPPEGAQRAEVAPRGRGLPRVQDGVSPSAADGLRWERLQEDHISESRALARAVDASMSSALPLSDRGVGKCSSRVLAGCAMPAIQIELGYITNRDEEALLSDEDFLRDAARAIARGIAAYRSGAKERAQ